jgi:hypothetical protein
LRKITKLNIEQNEEQGETMTNLTQEKLDLEKIDVDSKKKIMEKAGMNETQMAKIEQISKEGLVVNGKISQDFSINIVNGSGSYRYSKNTWWITINGYAVINGPSGGTWHFVAKDGKNVIFDQDGVKVGQQIPFKYKTGFSVDLTVTATWSQGGNTTLTGHLEVNY